MDPEAYREAIFQLCYHQHGGSGLSFTYASVMDMPLADLQWFLDRLDDERKKEASKLKSAGRRR